MIGGNAMYVISYDISNDRTRNKVAKVLEDYGKRVQYSVFECHLPEKVFEKLYRKLALQLREGEEGSIRIYRLCTRCETEILTIGMEPEGAREPKKDLFII